MKDETLIWLSYADENLDVAGLALEHGHLNACLQNAQQAVEKYLKAVIVRYGTVNNCGYLHVSDVAHCVSEIETPT